MYKIAEKKCSVREYWKLKHNVEIGTKVSWNNKLPKYEFDFLLEKWGSDLKIIWLHDYELFNVITPTGYFTADLNQVTQEENV